MRILPISYVHNQNINNRKKSEAVFTAHPDFYKYNSTQSCFFRRGSVLLACSKGYEDIENLFCKIFKTNPNILKSMLIIGIGSSQEPFSYLTSIKGVLQNKKLKNNLDLHTVDLQSKPEHKDLKMQAFCNLHDYQSFPKYAEKGFVKDNIDDWLEIKQERKLPPFIDEYMHYLLSYRDRWNELAKKYDTETVLDILKKEEKQKSMRWRVNDEVFNFVEQTYNNPQKSKWDSRIQEAILDYPDNKFDIISANNVLPYIVSERESAQTVKNIVRVLKPNGYFITDPYEKPFHVKVLSEYDNMKQKGLGIYQKV